METETQGKRVLVVDDEPFLVEIMKESLSLIGLEVLEAYTGTEALKILTNNDVDMLVTDLSLPDINGLELISQGKKIKPDLICIGVTGHVREYKYIDVIKAGAIDFIKKPFDIEELQVKVMRAFSERRHIKELQRLSQTDPLTGLLNRRSFFQKLRDEIKRSGRQGSKLSVMMLDLDGFKEINDTKGHLEGDRILKESAKIIRSKIRDGVDVAARYGGDEFSIMLVDAPESVLNRIANRIKADISKNLECGVSIGYATYKNGESAEDLVSEADKNLYTDKKKNKMARAAELVAEQNLIPIRDIM
jgi:diguanylate cyclase (GGDEF)-like protein